MRLYTIKTAAEKLGCGTTLLYQILTSPAMIRERRAIRRVLEWMGEVQKRA